MLDIGTASAHLRFMLQMSIRLYDGEGRLTDPDTEDPSHPLQTDAAFCAGLLAMRAADSPVIYHEEEAVLYAVIALPGEGSAIAGPVCYEKRQREATEATRRRHNIPAEYVYRVPLIPIDIFAEAVLMLFHCVSERRLVRNDLVISNEAYARVEENARLHLNQMFDYFRESEFRHNPYGQERREQQSIRDGDVERLKQSWQEQYEGRVGQLGPTPLRHYRNLAITNIALSSRSAIEGGVPPEIAYSMADVFTMETEMLNTPGEIVRLFRGAETEYAQLVQRYHSAQGVSPLVSACKELIHRKLHQHITVKELAEELRTSYAYLSNLFSRTEGLSLSAYIQREKIMASRHQLLYTLLPLDSIASQYGFCSQSHYGKTFKKWMDMTPGEYRSRHRAL